MTSTSLFTTAAGELAQITSAPVRIDALRVAHAAGRLQTLSEDLRDFSQLPINSPIVTNWVNAGGVYMRKVPGSKTQREGFVLQELGPMGDLDVLEAAQRAGKYNGITFTDRTALDAFVKDAVDVSHIINGKAPSGSRVIRLGEKQLPNGGVYEFPQFSQEPFTVAACYPHVTPELFVTRLKDLGRSTGFIMRFFSEKDNTGFARWLLRDDDGIYVDGSNFGRFVSVGAAEGGRTVPVETKVLDTDTLRASVLGIAPRYMGTDVVPQFAADLNTILDKYRT